MSDHIEHPILDRVGCFLRVQEDDDSIAVVLVGSNGGDLAALEVEVGSDEARLITWDADGNASDADDTVWQVMHKVIGPRSDADTGAPWCVVDRTGVLERFATEREAMLAVIGPELSIVHQELARAAARRRGGDAMSAADADRRREALANMDRVNARAAAAADPNAVEYEVTLTVAHTYLVTTTGRPEAIEEGWLLANDLGDLDGTVEVLKVVAVDPRRWTPEVAPEGTLCGICNESIVDGEDCYHWTAEDGFVHDSDTRGEEP